MRKVLHIENLDCPVCAEALQSDIQKIKGVHLAQVDYVTQTITLDVEDETAIVKAIKVAKLLWNDISENWNNLSLEQGSYIAGGRL